MRRSAKPTKWQKPANRVGSLASLQPGAHIGTPRFGYTHHGIYVGDGRVVQYGGLARGVHREPVEEVTLEHFADGHALWTVNDQASCFERDEVVRRARSRVGEARYRLLTNNCEHFCQWCLCAQHRSYQVDKWLLGPRRVAGLMFDGVQGASQIVLRSVETVLRNLRSKAFAVPCS
jgi:hypothetical protein